MEWCNVQDGTCIFCGIEVLGHTKINQVPDKQGSMGRTDSIETRLWLDDWGSIPGRTMIGYFFLFYCFQTGFGAHPVYLMGS